jgi:hypothetical protein
VPIYLNKRTGYKDGSSSTVALYINSSIVCGFFLSWQSVPPQYSEHSVWGHVGFYTIHTFLEALVESQFRIISKSYNFLFGINILLHFLDSPSSPVRVSMLLFLSFLCAVSLAWGRETYCNHHLAYFTM